MTELVNFIFHIVKISNVRHRLAFKQVVCFKSPSVYFRWKCFSILEGISLCELTFKVSQLLADALHEISSKTGDIDQESLQSSTTPDPGYNMGK